MPEAWRIEVEYLENCNCEVLCPCLLGPRNAKGGAAARPTEGHCDVPLVFRIARGNHGAVDLSDTAAALAIYTPGPMGDGNWTIGAYVDERARDDQRRALEQIFTGRAGGIPGVIWTLAGKRLPTRAAPIEVGQDGRRRRAGWWPRAFHLHDAARDRGHRSADPTRGLRSHRARRRAARIQAGGATDARRGRPHGDPEAPQDRRR